MERTVVGRLGGMEARNGGWMRWLIYEPGKQYPVKCDTKKPEIIAAATALMNMDVAAQINEEQSTTPNPHQPGTFFMNRYLNQIAAAVPGQISEAPAHNSTGAAAAPGHTQQQPQPGTGTVSYDSVREAKLKELRIMREHAMEQVMRAVASGVIENDPVTIVQSCETMLAYYVHGPARFGVPSGLKVDEPTPEPPPPPDPAAEYEAQQSFGDGPPPHDDDDIPF